MKRFVGWLKLGWGKSHNGFVQFETAFLIARAEKEGVLVGKSSLKHSRPEAVQRIKGKLDLDIQGCLARGQTSILPNYRGLGIGTASLCGLTSDTKRYEFYSLIREKGLGTR